MFRTNLTHFIFLLTFLPLNTSHAFPHSSTDEESEGLKPKDSGKRENPYQTF